MSLTQSQQPAAKSLDRDVVARMADFLTARTASAGSVDRDDLLAEFTPAQIDRNFAAARTRAQNAGRVRASAHGSRQ
jgi:hypothetical protein